MGDMYGGFFGEKTPCPLDDVHDFLCSYVAFPSSHAAVAVTLWAAHTHLVDAFDSTPRLSLLSPEKQCGKTRVLELLELICAGSERLNDASAAYMFHRIGAGPVTVLLDEADAIWKRGQGDESAEALRSIVNSGHRKGASVGRVQMVGQKAELMKYGTYAPVALAGIGDCIPETILDRSVVVRMRRRAPDETVQPYRERVTRPQGEQLREQLADWADSVYDAVGDPWPEMPEGVNDRPADVWEPLLMVADLAGGDWPKLAREACVALVTGARDDTASLGIRLLQDLWHAFCQGSETNETSETCLISAVSDVSHVSDTAATALPTETILKRLHAIEEAPWSDWYGKPLDARRLAKILKNYSVTSRQIRFGDKTVKGYRRDDLWDAWKRYGVLPSANVTEVTSVTGLASAVTDVTAVTHTRGACEVCGEPLDPVLLKEGRHVNC